MFEKYSKHKSKKKGKKAMYLMMMIDIAGSDLRQLREPVPQGHLHQLREHGHRLHGPPLLSPPGTFF